MFFSFNSSLFDLRPASLCPTVQNIPFVNLDTSKCYASTARRLLVPVSNEVCPAMVGAASSFQYSREKEKLCPDLGWGSMREVRQYVAIHADQKTG